MAIQHKDIPDAELHEPKGVAGASSSQIYVANGTGSGTWRRITENDISYSTFTNNKYGWNYRKDSQYTSGTPLVVTATKTLLTNNGGHPLTDQSRPLGITYENDQFITSSLNASYVMRVAMKVKTSSPAGTPHTLKVTMEGGAVPLQFAGQDMIIKGGGYVNDMLMSFLFFTGVNNTGQPIKVYVTPDVSMDIYDIDYLIQRTYLES